MSDVEDTLDSFSATDFPLGNEWYPPPTTHQGLPPQHHDPAISLDTPGAISPTHSSSKPPAHASGEGPSVAYVETANGIQPSVYGYYRTGFIADQTLPPPVATTATWRTDFADHGTSAASIHPQDHWSRRDHYPGLGNGYDPSTGSSTGTLNGMYSGSIQPATAYLYGQSDQRQIHRASRPTSDVNTSYPPVHSARASAYPTQVAARAGPSYGGLANVDFDHQGQIVNRQLRKGTRFNPYGRAFKNDVPSGIPAATNTVAYDNPIDNGRDVGRDVVSQYPFISNTIRVSASVALQNEDGASTQLADAPYPANIFSSVPQNLVDAMRSYGRVSETDESGVSDLTHHLGRRDGAAGFASAGFKDSRGIHVSLPMGDVDRQGFDGSLMYAPNRGNTETDFTCGSSIPAGSSPVTASTPASASNGTSSGANTHAARHAFSSTLSTAGLVAPRPVWPHSVMPDPPAVRLSGPLPDAALGSTSGAPVDASYAAYKTRGRGIRYQSVRKRARRRSSAPLSPDSGFAEGSTPDTFLTMEQANESDRAIYAETKTINHFCCINSCNHDFRSKTYHQACQHLNMCIGSYLACTTVNPHGPVQCPWEQGGTRCQTWIKIDNHGVKRHIVKKHFKKYEVRCRQCSAIFASKDSCERHIKRVCNVSYKPSVSG
ncbi:uncharacterized protein B0H18DRAFT_1024044 [Fomitopsis serialis]|uniref:uncharacterized protein n=1 Tax=Fomitopsis serialis TaxID=139415 RepID=UPI0020072CEF|nr:uncharacterized protein B0H18DRAFT_1024044 [Neoantrodia serialis]KAH9920456.1 hypothetical protein B0H18DRAFT_1024044 [Neoantrodia serialis]